jgi:hypothetical protein
MDVFYCGTQAMDWSGYNCDQCTKGPTDDVRNGSGPDGGINNLCDIENAVAEGMIIGHEAITEDIAKRMGHDEAKNSYNWRCPEFKAKEE